MHRKSCWNLTQILMQWNIPHSAKLFFFFLKNWATIKCEFLNSSLGQNDVLQCFNLWILYSEFFNQNDLNWGRQPAEYIGSNHRNLVYRPHTHWEQIYTCHHRETLNLYEISFGKFQNWAKLLLSPTFKNKQTKKQSSRYFTAINISNTDIKLPSVPKICPSSF